MTLNPVAMIRGAWLVALCIATAAPAANLPQHEAAVDAAAIRSDAPGRRLAKNRSSVHFLRGSLVLTGEALATIAENAERLKAHPEQSVTLIGYVEDLGSASYNIALAERRTAAIRDALIGMGVAVRQIRSSIVDGEPSGTAACETELCPAGDRRVEFAYADSR